MLTIIVNSDSKLIWKLMKSCNWAGIESVTRHFWNITNRWLPNRAEPRKSFNFQATFGLGNSSLLIPHCKITGDAYKPEVGVVQPAEYCCIYIQLVINRIHEFELLIFATFLNFGSRFWKYCFKLCVWQEIEILINKLAEITVSTDLYYLVSEFGDY